MSTLLCQRKRLAPNEYLVPNCSQGIVMTLPAAWGCGDYKVLHQKLMHTLAQVREQSSNVQYRQYLPYWCFNLSVSYERLEIVTKSMLDF
jgi:hypothetical protein